MRYHIGLFVLVCIAGLFSIVFSQEAAGASAGAPAAPAVTGSPVFPYEAEITGNDVNFRSGAGIGYYECGKLYKGDKIKILGMDGVWSKIQPPKGSFSWISAQYVKIDAADQSIGEITGNDVRVWAGSDRERPESSTTLQGKLSKGDKVKLLGEQLNNYYKIAVPSLPDAYYWVSTQYTKPFSPDTPVEKPVVKTTVGNPAIPAKDAANVADANAAVPAQQPHEPTTLDKYYELQKQMDVMRTKPVSEQNYSSIKEAFKAIADSNDDDKAARYSRIMIDRIEGFELALGIDDIVKQQNEQLKQINDKIEKAHLQRLGEIQNLGKYAVIGTLQNFLALGSGQYRIVSESGLNICYAMPEKNVSGRDLSGLIGKKVGLVGTIEPHPQTSGAMVRFSDIVSLK